MFKTNCQHAGFILTDLMLASGLSILLLSILIEIHLVNHRSLQLQSNLIQTRANAVSAINILTNEIHQAGYIGCARLTEDFPIASHALYSLTVKNRLCGISPNKIIIRHAGFPASSIKFARSRGNVIIANNTIMFAANNLVLISDCKHAEIVQIDHVYIEGLLQRIHLKNSLHHDYDASAEISRLEINTFYIADTGRKNKAGLPIASLYMQDIFHRSYELVENVSTIEFLYTVENELIDLPANLITDWSKVLGVAMTIKVDDDSINKQYHAYVTVS